VKLFASIAAAIMLCAPAIARDSLGVFDSWGAFRDPQVPRCYAIAAAESSSQQRRFEPFASVGTWPNRGVRNQLHIRLSREVREGGVIRLRVRRDTFELVGGGGDAWARHKRIDAAVIAAMRSASSMRVTAIDKSGNRFSDRYDLTGAATAIDAATVGCARRR
jgi:hypothetical protein